jgi:hypothetical protein
MDSGIDIYLSVAEPLHLGDRSLTSFSEVLQMHVTSWHCGFCDRHVYERMTIKRGSNVGFLE